ncbi:MAG: transposase [Gammaproteobacteria bacterium]
MPRIARPAFPGVPHHITQPGNRREDVFSVTRDRTAYLSLLGEYCVKHKVRVLADCLMTNHAHVVAVPVSEDAFEKVFRSLHTRYAQRVNRAKNRRGICGRAGSFPRR